MFLFSNLLANDMGLWFFASISVLIACVVLLQVLKLEDETLTPEPKPIKIARLVFALLAVPVSVLLAFPTEGYCLSHGHFGTPGIYVFAYLSRQFPSPQWLAWLWVVPVTDAFFYWCILVLVLPASPTIVRHIRKSITRTEAPCANV
jgi:hypothetical protein